MKSAPASPAIAEHVGGPVAAPCAMGSLEVRGERIVTTGLPTFAPVCVKCGCHDSPEPLFFRFKYIPAWARLVQHLFWTHVQRRVRAATQAQVLAVPLCGPCTRRWNRAFLFHYGALGICAALAVGAAYVGSQHDLRIPGTLLGTAIWLSSPFFAARSAASRQLRVLSIWGDTVELDGFHRAALLANTPRPSERFSRA